MTVALRGQAADSDDPLYAEGLEHLQAGEWQEAIRCFEELARRYPDNREVQAALDEARFKANLDATTTVKAKQWIIPWRSLVLRGLVVLAIIAFAIQGGRFSSGQVAPVLAQARFERQQAQLLAEANTLLKAGKLDSAEARFQELLALVPGHEEALRGLEQIAAERELLTLYQEAVALQEQGDDEGALAKLTELAARAPNYRDVNQRIAAIENRQETARLFAEADAAYQSGALLEAVAKYEEIRALDVSARSDFVANRLFELYLRLGREILDLDPPAAEAVPEALDYFSKALTLKPRDAEAGLEQRLARLFINGLEQYYAGQWNEAINRLRQVYDQRPQYLRGMVAAVLYDAYVHSGDGYRDGGDLYKAFDQYRLAAELPVADTTLAQGRMAEVQPFLTPTPTPTVTPTPAPPPPPAAPTLPPALLALINTPTPAPPTPTPVPLTALHNKIVFISDNPEQPGLWAMDPDGSNRQYLGDAVRKQYEALEEQASYSPPGYDQNGRHRVYTGQYSQLWIQPPSTDQFPNPAPRQLTDLLGESYDPVWSPDGSRIAFVSNAANSDDIYTIQPDGTARTRLIENTWEWDKHPFWSPDSTRIVFWSNRTGTKQIWIMDADGRNLVNVSNNSGWDEYDPIWIP